MAWTACIVNEGLSWQGNVVCLAKKRERKKKAETNSTSGRWCRRVVCHLCFLYRKRASKSLSFVSEPESNPRSSLIKKPHQVRAIHELTVEDRLGRGRPKITWEQVIRADMMAYGIVETLAEDRRTSKAAIRRPDPVTGGIRTLRQTWVLKTRRSKN